MAVTWKKVLLSGDVVNADIAAGAAIATSKLSGTVKSITGHGLGTAADLDYGTTASKIPQIGTSNLAPSKIIETDVSAKLVSVNKGTAYNKSFGTGTSNIVGIGSALAASSLLETDANGKLKTVTKKDVYDKDFGPNPGDVAEGNHSHSIRSLDDANFVLTADAILVYNNAGDDFRTESKASAFNKAFAGTGSASTVARSDHTHDYSGDFHPLGGDISTDFTVRNLTVAGEITQNSATELVVEDFTITVANGAHTAAGATGSGLIVDTSATNSERPSIIWDNVLGWTLKQGESLVGGNPTLGLPGVYDMAGTPIEPIVGDIWNKQDGSIYIAVSV